MAKEIIEFESVTRVYKERNINYLRVTLPVAMVRQKQIKQNTIYKFTIEV